MVHIEKFTAKGKEYYRLVYNIRMGDKVVHKTKYLGKEIPSNQVLKKITKEFLEKVIKKGTKYFSQKELKQIEEAKEEYIKELRKLNSSEKKKKLEEFLD